MQWFLVITLLLAPAYALRFGVGALDVNLLMLWVFLVWLVFVVYLSWAKQWMQFYRFLKNLLTTYYLLPTTIFFLAGLVSLFIGGYTMEKLGQFIVLFVQPISIFIIARYWSQKTGDSKKIENYLLLITYCLLAILGTYAVVQYFTLLGVPPEWWGNEIEPKRALAFFLHPNFFALFVTPLLAFTLPFAVKIQVLNSNVETLNKLENQNANFQNTVNGQMSPPEADPPCVEKVKCWLPAMAWVLGALGLLLSMSRGGWLGLAVAVGVFVLTLRNKKVFFSASVIVIFIVIVILSVPNLRYRLILPFMGEKSAVSRLSLIETGWKQIKVSPVLGSGLLGFSNNWEVYNTDPGLAHHPTPHNLFVAIWVDFGLLGLLSFLGITVLALWKGLSKNRTTMQFGLALAVVAILAHGLVDTPYMKNDLAMVLWILMSLI